MTSRSRVLVVLCGLIFFAILFVPMWQIQLSAPQYPEGLVLLIYPNKLGGNVDIVNGLNHYIGMKSLHAQDFFEFTILPYIIGCFAVAFLITGIRGSRKLLNVMFILLLCFGVIAMIDFWRWEHNYGHNLDPQAAIVVPGMTYDPPLIGFKQLLNFGAYSVPHIGGWLFIAAGLILLFAVISEWRSFGKKNRSVTAIAAPLAILLFVLTSSCTAKPEPIIVGKDNCAFCTMTVSDNRFGGEIITRKGKIYKFDDAGCLLSFVQQDNFDRSQVKEIYLTDFSNSHSLIRSDKALLLRCDALKAPMGGNISAFSNADSLEFVMKKYRGSAIHWSEFYKP